MNYVLDVNMIFMRWFCISSPSQPPTTFAKLMSEGGKKVWPAWELFKWFLGFSSHTLAAIGVWQSLSLCTFNWLTESSLRPCLINFIGNEMQISTANVFLWQAFPKVCRISKDFFPWCIWRWMHVIIVFFLSLFLRSGSSWAVPEFPSISIHSTAEGESAAGSGGDAGHRRSAAVPLSSPDRSQTSPPSFHTLQLLLHW